MTTEQKNLILTLDREGKANKEIQKETGLSAGTISMFLKKCREKKVDYFIQCLNCSKEVTIYKNRRERIDRLYCCKACRKEYYKRTGIEKSLKKICECCGKEFMTYPYRQARFCSKSCAKKSYHTKLQKSNWSHLFGWELLSSHCHDGFFIWKELHY